LTFSLDAKKGFAVEHLFDAVTNPEVSPVHVTGDNKDDCDRQMVMSHIGQPQ
jgi:hypothetical protein